MNYFYSTNKKIQGTNRSISWAFNYQIISFLTNQWISEILHCQCSHGERRNRKQQTVRPSLATPFSRTIVFQHLSISIDGQQILQFLKNIDFLNFDKTAEVFGKWQFFSVLFGLHSYVVACILSYTHGSTRANGHRMHAALH